VTTVALAESPLQLLNAVEAAHAGEVTGPYEIRWRADVGGLLRAAAAVAAEALPPGVRIVPTSRLRSGAPTARRGTYVLGDAFSGRGQVALLAGQPQRVILLDDGVSTLRALRLITAERTAPLLRVDGTESPTRRAIGSAAHSRLRRLAAQGGLSVFTALPLPESTRARLADMGVQVIDHRFAWVAGLRPADPVPEPVVVVGSAMVADGLIHPEHYLSWVQRITAGAPARYFPHRRCDARMLSRISALPGVVVEWAAAPVELRLRGLGPDQLVHCLPSSAFGLLSTVLRSSGTRVQGTPIPEHWWTPGAQPELRVQLASALDLAA